MRRASDRHANHVRHAGAVICLAGLLAFSVAPCALAWENDEPWADDAPSWQVHGFVEAAAGVRVRNQPLFSSDTPLGELRGQIEGLWETSHTTWRLKADGRVDGVDRRTHADLREANVAISLGARTDLRAGRQVLTWGTGDLLFLNDLFPKDWTSFLIGRDDETLKAPSDALRLSWFGEAVNVDTAWMPVFGPDRNIDGRRVAYFDPGRGGMVAAPPRLRAHTPTRTLRNGELAVRLYGLAGTAEWALYFYRGFSGQPSAFDPVRQRPTYARLNAYGASLRAPLAGGLYNLEFAWHDSADDRKGDDPNVPNSELRLLVGFERELVASLTLGAQYYLEWMQDYRRFRRAWPFESRLRPDERRHVLTLRLSYRMLRDNLVLSLMTFASPSDRDHFLRPTVEYRHSDRLRISAGANLFGGRHRHTFYGQFRDDSSVFVRARRSF